MTSKNAITGAVGALGLALALGLAGCGSTGSGGMPGMDHGSSSSSSAPAGGGSSTTAEFNAADVMFVQGMIPHHEQAVQMSDTLLSKSGVSADTVALARQIKAAQQPEIDTMKGWLTAWGKRTDGGMGGMDHGMGGGMATADELKRFDQAEGRDAEKLYLEMMTKHHEGAIAMARTEISGGKNADTISLATSIVSSQQAEIDTMKKLLARL